MKIDVTVATLNSSNTIWKCLNSIHQNIPYRKIIVVDGGSVDDTVKICKSFGAELISARGALLGETRFLQALNCETEWIAFIDSDVYVKKNWWTTINKHIKDDRGIINSRCLYKCTFEAYKRFFEYCWKSRPHPRVNVSFSNSLTRRELVLKCNHICRVHAGEDEVFFKYVKNLGLNNVTISGDLAYHDNDIYLHHPFAYFRMGWSIKNLKIKIPLLFYGKIRQWINYLLKLCVCQSAGILSHF